MNQPILSICIPTYNRVDYLEKCLASLMPQLVEAAIKEQVEIVVLDNASTDGTQGLVKQYQIQFDNIRYFRNNTTISAALNWNRAVGEARGKYINTIGDDDIYLPYSLTKLLSLLSSEKAHLVVVAKAFVSQNVVKLADNYTNGVIAVPTAKIAENFFNFSGQSSESNLELIPVFLFFARHAYEEVKQKTGYFWKDPIADHWAIFSVLRSQPALTFYDFPVIGYRIHAQNHLAIKFKRQEIQGMEDGFLKSHDKNFSKLPGPSFTNLIYLDMQDIQYHFPIYQRFAINRDTALFLHINNLWHSDFGWSEKLRYIMQSFFLIKQKKAVWLWQLMQDGVGYLVKQLIQLWRNLKTMKK